MVICVATLVEAFSKNRRQADDIEVQNNINNNNIDDLKSSKDSVLTRDMHLMKPKHKQGKPLIVLYGKGLKYIFQEDWSNCFFHFLL